MSKQEIDLYFTTNLKNLQRLAKGVAYLTNKKIDQDATISECYLYIIKNQSKITNKKELESFCVNWINQNIRWANSQLNKLELVNDNSEEMESPENEDEVMTFHLSKQTKERLEKIEDDEQELQLKIELEKWYDEKQSILAMYRSQQTDKIKQIIYDCYFIKNITKGTHLAKHLGINKDYGCKYVRELKQDIQTFYKQYKEKNNI